MQNLVTIITDEHYVMIVFFDECETNLVGCVYLYHKAEFKTAYLGMLTVRSDAQSRGYGTFILLVAETYAINNWDVQYTELMVLSHENHLKAYYGRRGYIDTGRIVSNPMYDVNPHIPKESNRKLCVLKKCVNKS
jgi:N-acetylglutamate synthase-like GNAT family acetyltransferase